MGRGNPSRHPKSNLLWPILSVLVASLVLPGFSIVQPANLEEKIQDILTAPEVANTLWGVHITDLRTGQKVFSQNDELVLIPASAHKLLTTATALDAIGPDYRFETKLHFKGSRGGALIRGDLILEGSADPTFESKEFRDMNPLKEWAEGLYAQGVRRIEGRIIGDDDIIDDEKYGQGWDVTHIARQSFAPAVSGLSSHDNHVRLRLQSSRIGSAPVVQASPPGYLTITNHAVTSARRRRQNINIDRELGSEAIVIEGSVPRTYNRGVEIPVFNPTMLTLHSFVQHLREVGITVEADLVDIDDLPKNYSYVSGNVLFTHYSPDLSEILYDINKESNNLYAELLFRVIGWGGSYEGGRRRINEFLDKGSIYREGLSVRDGSGLSRKNLISPRTFGEMLIRMNGHPNRSLFMSSLPRGGEEGTTLENRLREVPVWAKTGSIEYARALIGYVQGVDGRLYAFVLMANNYTVRSSQVLNAMDQVVRVLASNDAA